MMRLVIAGMAMLLMVAGSGMGSAAASDALPVADRAFVKLGEPAPNFQLRDLNGHLITLSDLRGKVVLLNFWATWCGPCRVEMPAMELLDVYAGQMQGFMGQAAPFGRYNTGQPMADPNYNFRAAARLPFYGGGWD